VLQGPARLTAKLGWLLKAGGAWAPFLGLEKRRTFSYQIDGERGRGGGWERDRWKEGCVRDGGEMGKGLRTDFAMTKGGMCGA